MTFKDLADLFRSAAARWSAHNAPRLGAALAFYSLLSLAPLLILVIAICSLVFSKSAAEQDLLVQVQSISGYSGAQTVRVLLENTRQAGTGLFATVIALITLLFGASGVFVELRASLNAIWGVPPPASSTWRYFIWQRLVSFVMVLSLGFLLLVSLLLTAAIALAGKRFAGFIPLHLASAAQVMNTLFSVIAIAVLFGLVFKFVPDLPIRWRDVAVGAITTAALFSAGKWLLAFYLTTAGVGSTYGAAGSLVAMLVWVYYSAQIFFFGAVFTRTYADRLSSPGAKTERAAPNPARLLPNSRTST